MTSPATPATEGTSDHSGPGILRPTPSGARAIGIAVVFAALVTVVGFVMKAHPVDVSGDVDLNRLRTGLVGSLATGIYHVFSPVPAVLITVVVAGLIWARARDLRTAAAFAGVVAGTWLPLAVVKLVVDRPRPEVALLAHPYTPALTDPSYPSGHTAFVTSLAIALVMVLGGTRWWSIATSIAAVVVAVVAVSLVVDGVHFPSDVLASIVWALAVAPAVRYLWVDLVMPRLPLWGTRSHPGA
ncbi:phosphatase PAP2 family protein [Dermatophilaceae bacterium Soc4.6]